MQFDGYNLPNTKNNVHLGRRKEIISPTVLNFASTILRGKNSVFIAILRIKNQLIVTLSKRYEKGIETEYAVAGADA